jgi:hypothetical protein
MGEQNWTPVCGFWISRQRQLTLKFRTKMRGVAHCIWCHLFITILDGSPPWRGAISSILLALCTGDVIIDVNTVVANGILDVGVTRQYLDGP